MKRIPLLFSLLLCAPAYANAPQNTNIAGPSASATGNVTNQAVQVLQGPYPSNSFGGGTVCTGPALTIAPFLVGSLNGNADPISYQTHNGNAGISLGISMPLDGSLTEICKARARVEIARQQAEADKARLDFELVRAIKCGEMMQRGIRFHPQSPYASVCADIVVINTNVNTTNDETTVSQTERS